MAWIQHIETLVPTAAYPQTFAAESMKTWTKGSKSGRYVDKVYAHSGIETRYSVIADLGGAGSDSACLFQIDGEMQHPSTGTRNDVFMIESRKMVREVAVRAVAQCEGVSARDITHVITVSCTGFYNPGPDLEVIKALDLPSTTQRYYLGFMGCYAAFPALKMASQFCAANPEANVLIVCVELCSLHMQLKDDLDSVVANSVFADGAAAVIVNNRPPAAGRRAFDLRHFVCRLVVEGESDMAWDIGDQGFTIVLSKYVAKIIGSGIHGIISDVLADSGLALGDIDIWAVHPGGRAILDKVAESLAIEPQQLQASREVLSSYGNMSSATILFVLKAILENPETLDGTKVMAMAFGPGLTIETAVLDVVIA